jgi:hypothetical protein
MDHGYIAIRAALHVQLYHIRPQFSRLTETGEAIVGRMGRGTAMPDA